MRQAGKTIIKKLSWRTRPAQAFLCSWVKLSKKPEKISIHIFPAGLYGRAYKGVKISGKVQRGCGRRVSGPGQALTVLGSIYGSLCYLGYIYISKDYIRGSKVKLFAYVLALLVAVVCGMYLQVGLESARFNDLERAAYILDVIEGAQR